MKPVRFQPSPPSRYPRRGRAAVSRLGAPLPGLEGGEGALRVPRWKRWWRASLERSPWWPWYVATVVGAGLVGGALGWIAVRMAF